MCKDVIENGDRIFKLLQKCQRNHNTPDLHSFEIEIKGGKAYVECRGYDEVFIESIKYGEAPDKTTKWCGTTIAAANRLEMIGADYSTIDM